MLKPDLAAIVFAERHSTGNNIANKQSHRVGEAVINEVYEDEIDSFGLIPDLFKRIGLLDDKQNTTHGTRLCVDQETGESEACTIAPAPSIWSLTYLRLLVALNGTHVGSRFKLILLTAMAVDATSQIVILSWALVPSESIK